MTRKLLLAGVAVLALSTAAQAQRNEIEMVHWWTSGGEAAALNVLKENLQRQGVTWRDNPIAGGSGVQAMTALRARVAAGNIPTSVQMLGFDILEWADQGLLGNLNAVAEREGWERVVPAALRRFSKPKGEWVSAPVNVHSTNWVWGNKAVLDAAGVTSMPTTWEQFIAALDRVRASGKIALAHGGQPWQDATIFEGVLLATAGPEFYKKAMIDLDQASLGSPQMRTVFERMTQLRGYVDNGFSGRDWNLASAMVIRGDAGFQMMGDWAKGEFISAGRRPGTDFVCFRTPGTQGTVTFNSDQFVMFRVGADRQEAQTRLAMATMDPAFQSSFNVIKGSAPARTDVSDAAFDDCGKKAIADLREADSKGTLHGSMAHGHANTPAVKNAMYDIITRHFNGQLTTDQALRELPRAVRSAM